MADVGSERDEAALAALFAHPRLAEHGRSGATVDRCGELVPGVLAGDQAGAHPPIVPRIRAVAGTNYARPGPWNWTTSEHG
jgi:hypothetical protein